MIRYGVMNEQDVHRIIPLNTTLAQGGMEITNHIHSLISSLIISSIYIAIKVYMGYYCETY